MTNFFQQQRKENNLTQQQVADALGVSVQAVSAWERGISFPNSRLLYGISRVFHVTIEQITESIALSNNHAPLGRSETNGVSPTPRSHLPRSAGRLLRGTGSLGPG